MKQSNPIVTILFANNLETVIQFNTVDGLPIEVKLGIEPLLETSQFNVSSNVKIFPNPSKSTFQIQIPNMNDNFVEIRIIDNSGRVLKTLRSETTKNIIFGDDLINGFYIVDIKISNKRYVYRILNL